MQMELRRATLTVAVRIVCDRRRELFHRTSRETTMRRLGLAMCAMVALAVMTGCAEGSGYASYSWPSYWGGPDVWYDGYYGPYSNGYWGPDMAFYYRDMTGHFIPDTGGHFRGQRFGGARGYRAQHSPH